MIGWMVYVLIFSQVSHCIWYIQYGVVHTTFFMLPVSMYALYAMYKQHYSGIFPPQAVFIGVSGLLVMCAPWFIIVCVPGDAAFVVYEMFASIGYPLVAATVIWPKLLALQAGPCEDAMGV